jgi:TonB family protein
MSPPTAPGGPKKPKKRSLVGPIVAGVALIAISFGIFKVVSGGSSQHKRVVDTVSLKLLPPPPPPPPKEEPPPPPKMVEKQKIQPPIDKPEEKVKQVDEPPPGPLALDAKGGPGSDSFGLGGKQGGADYVGGGGNGTRFGHYAVLMQDQITRRLHEDDKLDFAKFRATVKIWVSGNGHIARVEILHGTGDQDLDERIRQAIASMPGLPESPPADMPAAIVRVGARPTNET